MPRSNDLWIGATDDMPAPPRVRVRVFERCRGRCHRCGRKIRPGESWTLEHLIALINGGRNAEDMAIKAKSARIRSKHLGISKRPKMRGAGFRKAPPQLSASTPLWSGRRQ